MSATKKKHGNSMKSSSLLLETPLFSQNIRWLEPSMLLESSQVPIDLLNPIVFMLYPLLS